MHPTFKQFIHPEGATADGNSHKHLKAQAQDSYWASLQEIDSALTDRPWMMGDDFTLADPYAMVFFPWGRELKLPIMELKNFVAMKNRLLERPAARRALERQKSVLLSI